MGLEQFRVGHVLVPRPALLLLFRANLPIGGRDRDWSGRIMPAKPAADSAAATKNITKKIAGLGDWRGETLAAIRKLIHDACPDVVEEWKWMGTPVWSQDGIICTGETYKEVVKLTFARGAALADPKKLFNSSLEGNTRRAIDIREGEKPGAAAFKKLIQAAAAANTGALAQRTAAKKKIPKKKAPQKKTTRKKK
jgi:hypothetical protein